ncbi:nuclear envelope integral membrane protein 1 [Tetranychus urticae]|uniref:Nuclear envelope integral membrane protein 1 n=1 Tax=Tetranychus urticae TaxID=32264 RepID=T1KPL8_TETUR|nr:nuclear envelope integral membrane protein 1 [Tetranychus urticae]
MDLSTLIFLIFPILACSLAIINYNYNVSFDPLMIGLTLMGILLFYKAPSYSKSASFYYVCSLILGCLGSILVVFFVLGRFVPKRFAYATLIFGSSTIGFVYQLCKDRIYQQIIDYGTYIIWYTVIAAFITFAFAYRYGPPTHPKTLNLVQWTCQILALSLIMLSNSLPSVGLSLCGVLILHYNFSNLWEKLWLRCKKPEPRTLLTEDEYYLQGLLATQEELKKLREYCRSPEIDPWKVINKLKTPERFAKFMVTGEDVGEEERSVYDTSCFDDSEEMIEDMDTTGGDTLNGSQESLIFRENSIHSEVNVLSNAQNNSQNNSQINAQSTSNNFAFRPLYRLKPSILDKTTNSNSSDADIDNIMDQEMKKLDQIFSIN